MNKFFGELTQLKSIVAEAGLTGVWTEDEVNNKACFRARTGEVVNWYRKTGTIQHQGTKNSGFENAIAEKIIGNSTALPKTEPAKDGIRIFVVHGHDRDSRDQLELVLMRLGLQPYILQNQDGGSHTIIEALEINIYKDAAFGIILMTPDDFGYKKTETDADRQPRARQNVILEMGMVMASLGRNKMAILKKGALEMPSDADGIIRIEFNDRVQEIVPKLVQRLESAGIKIDPSKIASASA